MVKRTTSSSISNSLKSQNKKSHQKSHKQKSNIKSEKLDSFLSLSKESQLPQDSTALSTDCSTITNQNELTNYYSQHNYITVKTYGKDFINYQKLKEKENFINPNFLVKNNINPELRRTALKWIYTIIKNNNLSLYVYFLSVYIFDKYLSLERKNKKYHYVNYARKQLKEIAFTSLLIASKFENIAPFLLSGISMFKVKMIKKMEMKILSKINFDIEHFSSFHFIKSFFCDLNLRNSELIINLDSKNYIDILENISITLSKLLSLNEQFYYFSQSNIAIGCIIKSFDILVNNSERITPIQIEFLKQWINNLIDSNNQGNGRQIIFNVTSKIQDYWNNNQDFYIINEDQLVFD